MVFSASTTHALRAAAWLAAHGQGGAVLGRDLARELGIPPDYLSKVLATLTRCGLLIAVRGAKGGYRLARTPERIRLAELVTPFEARRVRSACLLRPERTCRSNAVCGAHGSWNGVNEAYREFLDRTTLADIKDDTVSRAPRRSARTGGKRAKRGPAPP